MDTSLTFAHPDFGVALVDVAPARAAEPVERLRRRLEALKTRPSLVDALPIVHLPLAASDLWRLNIILDSAFASPASLQGKEKGWVDVVQQALLPESFPPSPAEPEPIAVESAGRVVSAASPRGSFRPWMLAGVATAVLIGAAAVYGFKAPGQQVAPAQPGQHAEEAVEPAPPSTGTPDEPAVAAVRPAQPAPAAPAPAPHQQPAPPAVAGIRAVAPLRQEAAAPPGRPGGAVGPSRIVVHSVPAGRDTAQALLRSAADANDEVEFRTLRVTPDRAVVRYFYRADEAAAQELAKRLGPAWRVQDLTRYRPSPRPTTLEVWLPRSFRAD
ncbi:hypothetical protein [Teichococcus wenyumeiae]|uniref:hypothetical protein n=1 Tax=Teichococcus wenyumeiae TaxID=2478470 RepID=UPI0011C384F7|nr:hypothetical protein [Pseudoroseomonas wenyumeiae]